jgi:hypothetical protein
MAYQKEKRIKIDGKSYTPLGPTRHLIHGKQSNAIEFIQKRIGISPLNDVEKLEMENMLHETVARGIAFDIDSYAKQILINKLKDTDLQLLKYETDLMVTQERLSESERSMQFHKKVLSELKERYLTASEEERSSILEQIDLREKQIADFTRQLTAVLDLRNKIRKEIDKKDFQEASIKLKEEEMGKNTIDIKDVDFSALED